MSSKPSDDPIVQRVRLSFQAIHGDRIERLVLPGAATVGGDQPFELPDAPRGWCQIHLLWAHQAKYHVFSLAG
jgi:hypothetical protein